MEELAGLLLLGVLTGAVYALIAIGFVLLFKSSGVFNIAHGQLVVVGAFLFYAFYVQWRLPVYAAFVLTLVAAYLIGVLIYRLFLRPLISQPLISVVMVTVGLFVLMEGLVLAVWGPGARRYTPFLPGEPIRIAGVALAWDYIFGFCLVLALLLSLVAYFRFTKSGLVMRAVADSEKIALALGVDVGKEYSTAWGLSMVSAATGGIALAMILNVSPELGAVGLIALPAVILGGFESLPGAVVGGLIIGIVQNLAGGYLPSYMPNPKEITPYIVLLAILLIRPNGLWGLKRIERI